MSKILTVTLALFLASCVANEKRDLVEPEMPSTRQVAPAPETSVELVYEILVAESAKNRGDLTFQDVSQSWKLGPLLDRAVVPISNEKP